MKYPIGIQSFEKLREEGYVYVDKTELIYNLTHEGSVYFMARPRRFGKSLLVSTLECYFLGKKELFGGLAIERLETDWKAYPVFHLDFNTGSYAQPNSLTEAIGQALQQWEARYGVHSQVDDFGRRFAHVLEAAHAATGLRAVVLVDEYEKPLLDVMDAGRQTEGKPEALSLEESNRETLKTFYSALKAADAHLHFVFLTGVTKFSQVSMFSGFNQPNDISMDVRYDTLCGITDEELDACFAAPLQALADSYGMPMPDMRQWLKRQYDGYHFSWRMKGVYNPFSLLCALQKGEIGDYWFMTGTPTSLVRLLRRYDENLDELTANWHLAQDFIDYKADVERPLPMIYQGGYLTICEVQRRAGLFRLDFPNDEVRRGLVTLLASNYLQPTVSVNSWMAQAVAALEAGHLESFLQLLQSFLAGIPYTMRRKENERERERYFHYTFYLLMRLAGTFVVRTEVQQSQGRADCIVETARYVYVFEFKLDGTPDEALRQIVAQGYTRPYAADGRRVRAVGVNFSSATGTIDGWKAGFV